MLTLYVIHLCHQLISQKNLSVMFTVNDKFTDKD